MGRREQIAGAAIEAYLGDGMVALRRRAHRALRRGRRRAELFLQVDDPYSYLLVQALPGFLDRHAIDLTITLVPTGREAENPQPEMRRAHALADAAEAVRVFDVTFPELATLPSRRAVERAQAVLCKQRPSRFQLEVALALGGALFEGDEEAVEALAREHGEVAHVTPQLVAGGDRLRRQGHYMGGMLHYEGEWYWGIDRLDFLHRRLLAEGAASDWSLRRSEPLAAMKEEATELEMFHSFRSPYSYLALERTKALCERHGIRLKIKPVLPMVMRGLPVSRTKSFYIVRDCKRLARELRIPFGRIADPVGVGVERCLAVFHHACELERGYDFALAAGRAAWAEARNVAHDDGLRRAVERAGLEWDAAQRALEDQTWRAEVEANRAELFDMGLWGVPCYRLGGFSTWGQDRIESLEARL